MNFREMFAFVALLLLAHTRGQFPRRTLGMYVLLADDTVQNYTSTNTWQPSLYPFQQSGANVLFFTFINPSQMKVPPAYANLAKCRGSGKPGCPSSSQKIIFSVGGYSYSIKPNPWPFLESQAAAEAMAANVAKWDTLYGADGIDLDIESGAGDTATAGTNLVYFAKKLKQLNPKFIVTQPTDGYPQVKAEIDMVNNAWTKDRQSTGICDSLGLMVYSGLNSLNWVKDYANGTSQWDGFPIKVNVPTGNILAGINGNAPSSDIMNMATAIVQKDLGGMMVWMASVYDATRNKTAFTYGGGANDASKTKDSTGQAWTAALQKIQGR